MSSEALSLALVLLAVFIAVARLRDLWRQQPIEELMEIAFDPGQRRDAFDEFELTVRENRQILGGYQRDAHALRRAGRAQDAAEALVEGCDALTELAPGFLRALARLRELARPLVALASPDPIAPRSFGSRPLRGLGAASLLVHHLLLTGRERVLWHLRVLGASFRFGQRLLRRALRQLPARDDAWRRVDLLIRDLDTVGAVSLVTAHRILLTLDTYDRLQGLLSPPRR